MTAELIDWAYWVSSLYTDPPVYHRVRKWRLGEDWRIACGRVIQPWRSGEFVPLLGYLIAPGNAIRMGRACKRCFR